MAGENGEVVVDEAVAAGEVVQVGKAQVPAIEEVQIDEVQTMGVETVTVNNAPVKKTRVLLDSNGIGDERLHSLTDELSKLQSGVSIRAVSVLVGRVERPAVELAVGATRKDVLKSMKGFGLRELQGAKTVVQPKKQLRSQDSGVRIRLPEEKQE